MITNPSRLLPVISTRKLLDAPYRPMIRCAGHLDAGLDAETLERRLPHILDVLRNYHFDAIACQGLSGMLIAPILARELGKTLLIVRKTTEGCHSMRMVEGDYAARRYVIVDDFVSSGMTTQRIVDEIAEVMPNAKCIGICEYLYCRRDSELLSPPHRTPARYRVKQAIEVKSYV